MTCTVFNYMAKVWFQKHHKVDGISAEKVAARNDARIIL